MAKKQPVNPSAEPEIADATPASEPEADLAAEMQAGLTASQSETPSGDDNTVPEVLETPAEPDSSAELAQWRTRAEQAERERQQYQELAGWGQYYAQHHAQFQQYMQAQEKAEQEAAAEKQRLEAEKARPKWEAPEFDPGWLRLLQRDENGNIVAVPGAAPDLPQKYQKWQDFQLEKQTAFLRNPAGFLEEVLGDKYAVPDQRIEEVAGRVIETYMARRQAEEDARSFVQEHGAELYQTDKDGNIQVDPASGRPVFTDFGTQLSEFTQELAAAGVNPALHAGLVRKVLGLKGALGSGSASSAPAQPPTPAERNASLKDEFTRERTNGAARRGNRAATIAAAADPSGPAQNPNAGLKEMLRQELVKAGGD